jgi:hypothetical protein
MLSCHDCQNSRNCFAVSLPYFLSIWRSHSSLSGVKKPPERHDIHHQQIFLSTRITFLPHSASFFAANNPAIHQPMTTTSVFFSPSSGGQIHPFDCIKYDIHPL